MKKNFDKATTMQTGLHIIVNGLKKLMMNKSRTAYTRVKSFDRVFEDVFGFEEFGTSVLSASTAGQVAHIIDDFGFKALLQLVGDARTFNVLNSMVTTVEAIRKDGKFIKRCRNKNRIPDANVQKRYNKNLDLYRKAVKRLRNVSGLKNGKNASQTLKSFVKNGFDGDEQFSGNELFELGIGRGLDSFSGYGYDDDNERYLDKLLGRNSYDDDIYFDEDDEEPSWMAVLDQETKKQRNASKSQSTIDPSVISAINNLTSMQQQQQQQTLGLQQNMESMISAINNLVVAQQQRQQAPVFYTQPQTPPIQPQVTPLGGPVESGRNNEAVMTMIGQLNQKSTQTDQVLNKLAESINTITQTLNQSQPRQVRKKKGYNQSDVSPAFGNMFDDMDRYDNVDEDEDDEEPSYPHSGISMSDWNKIATNLEWVKLVERGVRDEKVLLKSLFKDAKVIMTNIPDDDQVYFKNELDSMIEYIKALGAGTDQQFVAQFKQNRELNMPGSRPIPEPLDYGEEELDDEEGDPVTADQVLGVAGASYSASTVNTQHQQQQQVAAVNPVKLNTDDYNLTHSTIPGSN